MVDVEIQSQLITELDRLSPPSQRQVLEYARSLAATKVPKGTPGRELLRFCGSLSNEEAEQMKRDIEEAFEQVEPNDW